MDTQLHPIRALSDVIAKDPEYAWAVHCNIAMPIKDAYAQTFGSATVMGWVTDEIQHKIANEAAAHLMQHLFGYDITGHELYEYGKSGAQSYAEFRIAMDEAEDAEIAAQGMEARRAETPQSGSVHDGPIGTADAPNSEGI